MKKILCILFSMLLILSFSACDSKANDVLNPNESEENNSNEDGASNSNEEEREIPKEEEEDHLDGEGERVLSFEERYDLTGEASFAKLKVSSILDDEYQEIEGRVTCNCLMVECIIEEDFYGVREKGTRIYVPILLSATTIFYEYDEDPKSKNIYERSESTTYYEKSEAIEWLNEYDSFLAHFRTSDDQLRKKDDTTEEYFPFVNMTNFCFLSWEWIIPVSDNKIIIQGQSDLWKYGDYTEYLNDGMPLDTASENLRNAAEKLRSKTIK